MVKITELLMHKILDENNGEMDAQLLLNEIQKRMPVFIQQIKEKRQSMYCIEEFNLRRIAFGDKRHGDKWQKAVKDHEQHKQTCEFCKMICNPMSD